MAVQWSFQDSVRTYMEKYLKVPEPESWERVGIMSAFKASTLCQQVQVMEASQGFTTQASKTCRYYYSVYVWVRTPT